ETCQVSGLFCHRRQQHLEGDQTIGVHLPGLPDDAHAAAAQLSQNFVTRNLGPARRNRGCCCCGLRAYRTTRIGWAAGTRIERRNVVDGRQATEGSASWRAPEARRRLLLIVRGGERRKTAPIVWDIPQRVLAGRPLVD